MVTAIGGVDGPPVAGTVRDVAPSEKAQPPVCVSVNVRPPIVRWPVRFGPSFAATLNVTLPLPLPPGPDVTVSHAASLVAVHGQPGLVLTATVPDAAALPTVRVESSRLYEHPPVCVTVNAWLPIVSRPTRPKPGFGSAVKVTLPGPLPVAPAVILNHGTSLVAIQPQPLVVATEIGADDPPLAGTVREVGSIVTKQEPAWVTATVCPATTTVPARAEPPLVATAIDTTPLPVPPDGAIAIHVESDAAVQAHDAPVVTDTCDVPPPGWTLSASGVTEKAQGAGGPGGGGVGGTGGVVGGGGGTGGAGGGGPGVV